MYEDDTDPHEREWNIFLLLLETAVPLQAIRIQARGGPTQEDRERVAGYSEAIGALPLFTKRPKGETDRIFNMIAESVAVLAFFPGGVAAFGKHFEYHQKTPGGTQC